MILLLGARLNWILHFGRPPRFSPEVKIIQIDVMAEELHNSREAAVALQGDIKATMQIMLSHTGSFKLAPDCQWWKDLRHQVEVNREATAELTEDKSVPMNFYAVFDILQSMMPENVIVVSEGANTMDIGRAFLKNHAPRRRLDAGSFGTMGVGLGFAIAAAMYAKDNSPSTRIVCVEGDSAFGFSGMEMETIVRHKLPIIVVIVNNNGIYGGLDQELFEEIRGDEPGRNLPPTALLPTAHYEKFADVLGLDKSRGSLCRTEAEIRQAFTKALATNDSPSILNIMINPMAQRKAQAFDWLTRSKI